MPLDSTNLHTLTEDEFYSKLQALLSQLEDNRPDPYFCTSGEPTIGIGFNLRIESVRDDVFDAMGIEDATTKAALTAVINDTTITDEATLQSSLDAVLGYAFEMTSSQIDTTKWGQVNNA